MNNQYFQTLGSPSAASSTFNVSTISSGTFIVVPPSAISDCIPLPSRFSLIVPVSDGVKLLYKGTKVVLVMKNV